MNKFLRSTVKISIIGAVGFGLYSYFLTTEAKTALTRTSKKVYTLLKNSNKVSQLQEDKIQQEKLQELQYIVLNEWNNLNL